MALKITITDPRIIQILEAEAASAGISESEAVEQVIAKQHQTTQSTQEMPVPGFTVEEIERRMQRLDILLREIHERITDKDRAFDYNAWLYDENGLPH